MSYSGKGDRNIGRQRDRQIRVIDSHTGGEPTRIIVDGGPDLGDGPLADRVKIFQQHFDDIRASVINEPRGSDVLVGGLLCRPHDPSCEAGIIFFNNTGYLGMCGHGTIGLMVTLAWMQRRAPGICRIETPVGVVTATLHDENRVTVRNVPSWRYRKDVSVRIPETASESEARRTANGEHRSLSGKGRIVRGDVAWGGNWFFLTSDHGQELKLSCVRHLTDFASGIRDALLKERITGANGAEIDHVELFGPPTSVAADSRNFVLCPGGAFDRSPCGTGTSAKLACLAADGKLAAGEIWRQESIVGSIFEGEWHPPTDEQSTAVPSETLHHSEAASVIVPSITGSAWVTGESTLIFQESDPFRAGITS